MMDQIDVEHLRNEGWLSPDDRLQLANGIDWLSIKHHETLHKEMIRQGRITSSSCDAQTCKFATQLIWWLRTRTII